MNASTGTRLLCKSCITAQPQMPTPARPGDLTDVEKVHRLSAVLSVSLAGKEVPPKEERDGRVPKHRSKHHCNTTQRYYENEPTNDENDEKYVPIKKRVSTVIDNLLYRVPPVLQPGLLLNLPKHRWSVATPLAVHPGHPAPPAVASARGLSAVRAVHGGFLNVMHSVVGR